MKSKHPDLFNASLNNEGEMEPTIIRPEDSVSNMHEPAIHIKEEPIDINEVEGVPRYLEDIGPPEPLIHHIKVEPTQDTFSNNLETGDHEEEELKDTIDHGFSFEENGTEPFAEKIDDPMSNTQELHFVDISEPSVQVKDEPIDDI